MGKYVSPSYLFGDAESINKVKTLKIDHLVNICSALPQIPAHFKTYRGLK